MARGGTKIYCPGCSSFSICKALSPTTMGKPKAQRWHRTDFNDISWFRRARQCLSCGHTFLTSEVDEAYISELVELRNRLAEKNQSIVRKIRRKTNWLKRDEVVPLEVAKDFIRASTWWLTHSSGLPVKAPRHANRIYKSYHGWAVDFGSNTFLVGKAVERCKNVVNEYLDVASKGLLPLKSEVVASLKRQISGAVANADGNEYSGYYPIDHGELVFGATAIDLDDAAKYLFKETGMDEIVHNT